MSSFVFILMGTLIMVMLKRVHSADKKEEIISIEKQVIVHVKYKGSFYKNQIGILKSTFLCSKNSDHKSELLFTENISVYPKRTYVPYGKNKIFTLIFSGLPKSCREFDLFENISDGEACVIQNISRNGSDVYTVNIAWLP